MTDTGNNLSTEMHKPSTLRPKPLPNHTDIQKWHCIGTKAQRNSTSHLGIHLNPHTPHHINVTDQAKLDRDQSIPTLTSLHHQPFTPNFINTQQKPHGDVRAEKTKINSTAVPRRSCRESRGGRPCRGR